MESLVVTRTRGLRPVFPETRWLHENVVGAEGGLPEAAELARRFVAAAHVVVGRRDVDPLLRADLLTFLVALRIARPRLMTACSGKEAALVDETAASCLATRELALEESLGSLRFCATRGGPVPARPEELAALSRRERLSLQSNLVRANHEDMERVSTRMARFAGPDPGAVILNVGDGVPFRSSFLRRLTRAWGPRLEGCHVATIDVGGAINVLARDALAEGGGRGVALSFHRMDGARAAFADGTFSAVYASFMIDDCEDPEGLLREMCRVLEAGGTLSVSGHHLDDATPASGFVHNFSDLHEWRIRVSEVVAWAAALGLEPRAVEERPHAWFAAFGESGSGL